LKSLLIVRLNILQNLLRSGIESARHPFIVSSMQVGESVRVVAAFPGVSSLCAFGCESGRIGVFDSESNRLTFNARQTRQVTSLVVLDESVFFTADSQRVFRHDTRTTDGPALQFQTLSEIKDIAVSGNCICAATTRHGISMSDSRTLQRMIAHSKPNSIPPSLISFAGSQLIACYEDGCVVSWDPITEANTDLEIPRLIANRRLAALGIASLESQNDQTVIVGYESGVSVYQNAQFQEHTSFECKERFGPITNAPCLGPAYFIAVIDQSTLIPCQLGKEPGKRVTLHGADICSVSANYLMVCVADRDDEGYIGAIMSESFGDEFL
jgi:hypothetical protein